MDIALLRIREVDCPPTRLVAPTGRRNVARGGTPGKRRLSPIKPCKGGRDRRLRSAALPGLRKRDDHFQGFTPGYIPPPLTGLIIAMSQPSWSRMPSSLSLLTIS